MSSFLAGAALAKPFLLLTFACTNPSMQDCQVFTERFSSSQECESVSLEVQFLPRESLESFLPEIYTDTVVSYCSYAPQEDSPAEVLNFILPLNPQTAKQKSEF